MKPLDWPNRYEWATAQDPSRNYCLWDYTPPAPAEDKYRSINLLLQSFQVGGCGEAAWRLIEALREAIGPFRTVYGIKSVGGALAWEFYFYDYRRAGREVSMTRVLAALAPFARCPVVPNEQLPYFMFSLDVDDELANGRREVDVVHMYVGNPGSSVSSGIAYALEAQRTTLENFYFFFDARSQRPEAAAKIASSAYFDASRLPVEAALMPELSECETICIANKRTHDCVYFSGVTVGQLAWFLERFEYPPATRQFVADNRGRLDHLLFDVGVDYRMEGGRLRHLKTGYYGVF
jgi:hypothetical protein